jgi:hypothetical protein
MDTHSFAILIGVGATTVNPYLAIDSIHQRFEKNYLANLILKHVLINLKNRLMLVFLKLCQRWEYQ